MDPGAVDVPMDVDVTSGKYQALNHHNFVFTVQQFGDESMMKSIWNDTLKEWLIQMMMAWIALIASDHYSEHHTKIAQMFVTMVYMTKGKHG